MKVKKLNQLPAWKASAIRNLRKYLRLHENPPVLRGLQIPLFSDVIDFVQSGKNAGYVSAPMGTGKTVIFTEFANALKQRVIVVVPSILLIHQTREEIASFAPSLRVGLLYSKKKQYDTDVVITTYTSLGIGIKNGTLKVKDFNWLILDEAHESLSVSRQKVVNRFKHAIRLGFTASEKYDEEKQLSKLLPNEIHRITILEAVESGLLCPFSVVIAQTTTDLSKVGSVNGDYDKKQLEKAVNKEGRNRSAVALYETTPFYKGKSLMCHCVSIEHAEAVARKFRANGWRAEAVHSQIEDDTRGKRLQDFCSGKLTVLCNVDILTRGFNAPIVSICFNLRPTRSLVVATQRARNLRIDRNNSDKFAVVVDFVDANFNRSNPPLTFDKVVDGSALVVPSFWKDNKIFSEISKQLQPAIPIDDLKVYVETSEVLRITGSMQKWEESKWVSEKDIKDLFNQKGWKNQREYDSQRTNFVGFPHSVNFPDVYKKTFGEVVFGKKGLKDVEWLFAEEIKKLFFENDWKNQKGYEKNKPSNCPSPSNFPRIYNTTFSEMMYGRKKEVNGVWLSEEQVRELFLKEKWKNQAEYDKKRPSGCPSFSNFRKFYGKPFKEVMYPNGKWPSEVDVKKLFIENKWKDYKEYNKNKPKNYPYSFHFPDIYKKTFNQLVGGEYRKHL
ncbi:MAG: DEAD/DEAH box helicase family protein [Candidatus Nomurabacteria bacterium]|nr:DEAD/DEAH box helicase family protein [Candidatus Nomurabacteria bacterium]